MTEYTKEDEELWGEMQSQIRTDDVEVTFIKKDGSDRVMICTLREAAYADYSFGSERPGRGTDVQTVWDLEKNAWRSLKKGTLTKVVPLDTNH